MTCFDGFQRKTMSTVAYLVLISLDHDVLSRSSSHKPNVPKLSHLPFCFKKANTTLNIRNLVWEEMKTQLTSALIYLN